MSVLTLLKRGRGLKTKKRVWGPVLGMCVQYIISILYCNLMNSALHYPGFFEGLCSVDYSTTKALEAWVRPPSGL